LQTPPQLLPTPLPTHALAQAAPVSHCPLVPQVKTVTSSLHCVVPGRQAPPHCAVPPETTHALGHVDADHCPDELQVCSVKLSLAHWVAPGEQTPVQAPLTQACPLHDA
jgi:hypothetical protein